MRMKSMLLVCVLLVFIAFPAGVSAQEVKTVFGMNYGRVILTVSHRYSRVNVVVQPIFTGNVDNENRLQPFDVQWIIPLPAPVNHSGPDEGSNYPRYLPPEYQEAFDQVDEVTRVRFEPEEPRYCYDTFIYGGYSSSMDVILPVTMDYGGAAAIPNDAPDAMLNQLAQEGFVITPDDAPRIRQYAEAGFSLVAVKYHLADMIDDPIAGYIVSGTLFNFSFQWDDMTVPLPFLQGATAWIFSDQAYLPANIPHVQPDYARFRAPHSVAHTGDFTYWDFSHNNYTTITEGLYQDALNSPLADGHVITEYAGSTDILLTIDETSRLNWLAEDFSYLSRLVIQTPDTAAYPVIAPAPDEPDRSNVIDLRNYVDPLVYWGCSSRTALEGDPLPNLFGSFMFYHSVRPSVADIPSGRMRRDDLRFAVAYPPDWVLSTLPTDTGTVYALSPEPLTLETVKAAASGDTEQPPIFVFSEYIYLADGFAGPVITEQNLETQLGIPIRVYMRIRYDMRSAEMEDEHGVQYGMIASEADWTANRALYNAMLTYAQSYQYYASADWQNTLFIGSPYWGYNQDEPHLEIPYPDGWLEHMDGEDIVISGGDTEFRLIPTAKASPEWIRQRYGLTGELSCEQPTIFHAGERAGYIFPTTGYLAEVSAPTEMLGDYIQIMLKMMAALPSACSG
ncbi:MAG: hypothetical protein H6671_10475 [Anaerolineaceae bacterium]|nr:hypothetical protein [Anaerolineaceae bacterium]